MLRALRTAAPKFMLASLVIAAVSAGIIGRAQGQSADIPLQLVSFGTGSSQTYSLGINIGIGSGAPKPYLFDTGSAPFNAGYSPQWWPSSITPTNPLPLAIGISYSYATGTTLTGNVVTVPSISFYASSRATMPSYTLPTLTPGYQVTAITSSTIPDFSNLIQNNQPFIRGSFLVCLARATSSTLYARLAGHSRSAAYSVSQLFRAQRRATWSLRTGSGSPR